MSVLACVIATGLIVSQVQAAGPERSPDAIAAAIERLGADRYEVRQSAMEQLWAAGPAALPALELATQSNNAEVRYRAQFVLENLRLGVTADTPPRLMREVQRFRSPLVEDRRRAMKQLESANRPRIILGLLQTELDQRTRQEWFVILKRTVIRSLAAGKLDEVAEVLRLAAEDQTPEGEEWIRHWVAFVAQRGDVDRELDRLNSLTTLPGEQLAKRRALLLRAKGELPEAVLAAEQAGPALSLSLLIENRDWDEAARRLVKTIESLPDNAEPETEQLALAAAYFRLADDAHESRRWSQQLVARGERLTLEIDQVDAMQQHKRDELVQRRWQVAKALLLNGEYDQSLRLIQREQLPFVFELLCNQNRYRDAFAAAGVEYPHGFDEAWFQQLAKDLGATDKATDQRFATAQLVLRQLSFLGEAEAMRRNLSLLIESSLQGAESRWPALCEVAVKMGLREEALRLAAKMLTKEERPTVLSVLYPARSSAATLWWETRRELHAHESPEAALAYIERLLQPQPPASSTESRAIEIERACEEAAVRAAKLPVGKQIELWHELAETCLMYGRRDLAKSYFAQAAAGSVNDAIKLGDLLAAEGKWSEAAEWYRKASAFDDTKALPRFLYARALQRNGAHPDAEQWANWATLMPLADPDQRHEFATGLKERGYRDESRMHFELLMRTGDAQSGKVVDASKQVGNLIHQQDELRAAECWQTMLLCCMNPNWAFVEPVGYIQIPHLVHKTRAKGLLKAGDFEAAMQEIAASRAASPGNIELAEELVPRLETAGRTQEAADVYDRSADQLRQLVEDFPKCATLHNNLAWLNARCKRNLDEALQHVQRALELEPNKPSFVDTLGEVYFCRGQTAEAIASAERCLEQEPGNAHYQSQLKRFRGEK